MPPAVFWQMIRDLPGPNNRIQIVCCCSLKRTLDGRQKELAIAITGGDTDLESNAMRDLSGCAILLEQHCLLSGHLKEARKALEFLIPREVFVVANGTDIALSDERTMLAGIEFR